MTVGGRRTVGGVFDLETNNGDSGIVRELVRECWPDGAGGATKKTSVNLLRGELYKIRQVVCLGMVGIL